MLLLLRACLLAVLLLAPAYQTSALEQVFAFNNLAEPESLDHALTYGVPEFNITIGLFEGLVIMHPKTLEPLPGVAARWDISKDGRTYTFYIRDNARWSNGDPVTAQDFVYSYRRVLEPATAAPYAHHMHYIVGGKDYNSGKLKDFNRVGIKALSARVLEIRLNHPAPYFANLLTQFPYFPVHKKTVENYGNRWTRPEHMVSNGAFRLKEWRQQDRIVMERSPKYWDAANVRLQRVVVYPIENKETGLNLYKKGKIHWTGTSHLPEPRIPELKKRADYHAPIWLGTYFFRFNVTRPPFDNLDVRKAFTLAVDRQLIVDKVTQTGEVPAHSLTPLTMPNYKIPKGPTFDAKRAAEHLSRAGYCAPGYRKKGCKPFPKTEALYNTNERHKLVLLAMQQMWKEHLGIDTLSLVNREWKVYLKEQKALDYMIARAGWIADFADPINFLDLFVTGNTLNQTGWGNSKYDELIEKSRYEPDPSKREKILQRAERILLAELPILPIFYYATPYLLNPRVGGFYETYLDIHPYKSIYMKESS